MGSRLIQAHVKKTFFVVGNLKMKYLKEHNRRGSATDSGAFLHVTFSGHDATPSPSEHHSTEIDHPPIALTLVTIPIRRAEDSVSRN